MTRAAHLIPPGAIFLGWFFLEEALHHSAFAGFALIALGLFIIDGRGTKHLQQRFHRRSIDE